MCRAFAHASDRRGTDPMSHELVDSLGALGRPAKHLGFVHVEMTAMLEAVNTIRTEAGLGAIDLADTACVGIQAAGHCDYRAKHTLYCAELAAVGDRSARP